MAELDDLNYDEPDDLYEQYNQDLVEVEESVEESNEQVSEESSEESSNKQDEIKSSLDRLLNSKGITDKNNIKFENEDGTVESRSWDDLTEDEKYNILSQAEDNTSDTDLDDKEIDLINRIRLSGMSVEDYIQSEVQKGISDYASKNQPEYQYTVDDLSDDELFVLDLQTKVEDISEDELRQALENAKSNETLFKKQMDGLRNDYKRLEDQKNEQERALQESQQQEEYQLFSNGILSSIDGFQSVGDLDVSLEDEDKEELAQFILGRDATGVSYLGKALNDPDTLVRLAWFALHGEDTFNSISDYYKNVISLVSKTNYEKGLADGKKGTTSKLVVNPEKRNQQSRRQLKSVDDINY